nr:MAG TPA: hypothetical protein [Caudoviricetes sp.]
MIYICIKLVSCRRHFFATIYDIVSDSHYAAYILATPMVGVARSMGI